MTDALDELRGVMSSPEDVDLPDLPDPPQTDGKYSGSHIPPGPPPPSEDEPALPEQVCAEFPLNDFGNGKRFVTHFGENVIFVPRVGWFVWNGKVWKKDPDEIDVRRMAQQVSGLIERETRYITVPPKKAALVDRKTLIDERLAELASKDSLSEEDRAEDLQLRSDAAEIKTLLGRVQDRIGQRLRHAKNAGNSGPIGNMRGEAQTMLAHPLEDLDADALSINTEGGVLRFSVSGGGDSGYSRTASVEMVPHSRDHLMTKMMPVTFDPDAKCPRFDAFIERIMPSGEMRRFLQRWYGLSMTALTVQKLIFQYGSGANGKSVLTDLMARIMAGYAATAKVESLTGKNRRGGSDATPDLIPLIGARMVRASEPDEGERLQEGLIKELTGGEPIQVRALHADFVEVLPYFKLTMSGNHKPEIRGTDDGIWRRVLLVPFDVQIPANERIDKAELDAMLWEERSGIMNWLVEGLIDYLEGGLQEPETVLLATQEFRDESDPVGFFLNTACVVSGEPEDSISARDLVEAFQFWQMQEGSGQWTESTISKRLAAKSERWRAANGNRFSDRKSNGFKRYDGIRLEDLFNRGFRNAPRDHLGKIIRTRSEDQA